jgi:hypothetical protein
MEEDMENFLRFKLMPRSQLKLKTHVVPHIFDGQPTQTSLGRRSVIEKKNAARLISDALETAASANEVCPFSEKDSAEEDSHVYIEKEDVKEETADCDPFNNEEEDGQPVQLQCRLSHQSKGTVCTPRPS